MSQSETGAMNLSDFPDVIDATVFDQILEMDDDPDDREFSREIVTGFFEQAENTLRDMQDNVKEKNLSGLSSLGHFLKGSSATLGLVKVQKSCEKIQNFGKGKDATGEQDEADSDKSVKNISNSLDDVRAEYAEAKALLQRFFSLDD